MGPRTPKAHISAREGPAIGRNHGWSLLAIAGVPYTLAWTAPGAGSSSLGECMGELSATELFLEAETLAEMGEDHFATAFDKVEAGLRLEPENTDGLKLKGLLLDTVGHYNEAFMCYSRAVELDPDNVEVRIALADNCLYRGDFDEAIRMWRDITYKLTIADSLSGVAEETWVEVTERRLETVLAWHEMGDYDRRDLKDEVDEIEALIARLRLRYPTSTELAVIHGRFLDEKPQDLVG
jgi:cytochrome c-type biogenesis protein CcmH/NrfG